MAVSVLTVAPWLGVFAQEPVADRSRGFSPAGGSNGIVRQIGPSQFEVGKVRIDRSRSAVTFPAAVNLREGPIEYVLVADYGKIHESLLRTDVPPYHVQLALLLLGAQPAGTNSFSTESLSTNSATQRLLVEVSWRTWWRSRSRPAGDFVQDRKVRRRIRQGQWIFAGSRFRDDGFAAQADGSIITVIDDPDAIIGSRLEGTEDDDNWLAVGKDLPPLDSIVQVTLTLVPGKSR